MIGTIRSEWLRSGRTSRLAGHSVLVTSRDDDITIVHNLDGKFGNKPNQILDTALLDQAWSMGNYAVRS